MDDDGEDLYQAPPRPSDSIAFDGNLIDLDRVLGYVAFQFILFPRAFVSDQVKSAYLLSHFRGPPQDWATGILARNAAYLNNYSTLVGTVQDKFGLGAEQRIAAAQTRLTALKIGEKSLPEGLAEFEALTDEIGCRSDVARLSIIWPKLPKYYYESMVSGGDTISTWSVLRNRLMNVYARQPEQALDPESKRKKSRCKKCGKRGHTAVQCEAAN